MRSYVKIVLKSNRKRATRFELAIFCLENRHSTAELRPLCVIFYCVTRLLSRYEDIPCMYCVTARAQLWPLAAQGGQYAGSMS